MDNIIILVHTLGSFFPVPGVAMDGVHLINKMEFLSKFYRKFTSITTYYLGQPYIHVA